jgi:UDP:flavonoid glycosyltransferase YjiC (YdhE family)
MATILFAWELGSGLGHMMQMSPLALALVKRGHKVYVALRDVGAAEAAFAGSGVCYLEAPHDQLGGRPQPFPMTRTFAHVLANVGWNDGGRLFALSCAWANLYSLMRTDLCVFDHAPTALLASRGLPMRRVVIGSGFCIPPDLSPWPMLRRELRGTPEAQRAAKDEEKVLARVNRLLGHWGMEPLGRLGQLYSEVDETFLTTLPELEQYPARPNAKYRGPVLPDGGEAPEWPGGGADEDRGWRIEDSAGAGGPSSILRSPSSSSPRRIFAYLKRFDGLEGLAAALRDWRHRTLLYVDGLSDAERRRRESANLRVTAKRVDLRRAAAECDAAVLHAGQGATAAVLLAGKPVLQIPLVLEQRLTAEAMARLGAGIVVTDRAKDPAAAAQKLDLLLTDPRYATAARGFARKYESFDPAAQVERMVVRVEELIGQRGRGGDKQKGRQADRRAKVFAG